MGVILALMQLFSTLLASVLASERLTVTRLVDGVISIAGLVYLTSRGDPVSLAHGGLHIGDALMVVAMFANALSWCVAQALGLYLPVWEQLFWQILVAALVLLPLWLMEPMSAIMPDNLPLILFAAIPTSLLAPLCWMVEIARLGAARTPADSILEQHVKPDTFAQCELDGLPTTRMLRVVLSLRRIPDSEGD